MQQLCSNAEALGEAGGSLRNSVCRLQGIVKFDWAAHTVQVELRKAERTAKMSFASDAGSLLANITIPLSELRGAGWP